MPTITRTKGDTAKDIILTLTGSDGAVQNLTGVTTVKLRAMRRSTRANVADITCTVEGAAANGQVRVPAGGLDAIPVGSYDYQTWVTFVDGKTAPFPDDGYDALEVVAAVPAGS